MYFSCINIFLFLNVVKKNTIPFFLIHCVIFFKLFKFFLNQNFFFINIPTFIINYDNKAIKNKQTNNQQQLYKSKISIPFFKQINFLKQNKKILIFYNIQIINYTLLMYFF